MNKIVEILAWIGRRIGKPPGWERVVRLLASPEKCRNMRDLCVVADKCVFIVQPSVPLGWHIAFFGTYEPELREIFSIAVPVNGVAVDIGANVGWHTLLLARLVGPDGRVFAIEANPSVRERLERNVSNNRLSQVEIIPYAVLATEGPVSFYGPDAGDAASGDGHVAAPTNIPDGDRIISVEARRVDTILSAAYIDRLDLIKIDIEGFEWPALQSAEQTISKFRPNIIFEYNSQYASRGGGTPQLLNDFFQRHRYRLFAVGRNWAEGVELRNWPECSDIWAMPLS